MGRKRAILLTAMMPVLLAVSGCANFRLPAIDPSGRRLFLPSPNYTTLAPDGFLSRLHNRRGGVRSPGLVNGPNSTATPLPGPYQPAFAPLLQHTGDKLRRFGDGTRRLLTGLHGNGRGLFGSTSRSPATLFGNSAFPRVPNPPLCGPDGQAPDGSPCYPVGSPSASSLAATLPGAAGRIGTGLNNGCSPTGLQRFDQVGPGVILAQRRYTARVGEEVVVLGAIQSRSGIARGGEAVKWTLSNDSVGTIVDAARPVRQRPRLLGFLHRTSARPGDCGSCVDSTTSDRCRVVTRNPGTPADDVYLSKGQSWVSLTSGSAGQSFITLAAPGLQSGRRAATAIIDWTDATWQFPRPILNSTEGPGQLITKVFRNTTRAPLSNWIVRYTYIDGPEVTFDDGTDKPVNVKTDYEGQAILTAFPTPSKQAGTTRFAIQIFDPELPDQPLQQGIGYITWSESEPVGSELVYPAEAPYDPPSEAALGPPTFDPPDPITEVDPTEPFTTPPIVQAPEPQTQPEPQVESKTPLSIQVAQRPPGNLSIGDRVVFDIEVENAGAEATARDVVVTLNDRLSADRLLGPLKLVGSQPQGLFQDGNQYVLAWELYELRPRQIKRIQMAFDVVDVVPQFQQGPFRQVIKATAENSVEQAETEFALAVTGAVLDLRVAPLQRAAVPKVGEQVVFAAELFNRTKQRLKAQLIVRDWTDGLSLIPRDPQAEIPQGKRLMVFDQNDPRLVLAPGPSQVLSIPFNVVGPGPQSFVVESVFPIPGSQPVTRRVDLNAIAAAPVPKANVIDWFQPKELLADESGVVSVTITNTSPDVLTDVRFSYTGSSDLTPTQASSPNYQVSGTEDRLILTWSLERMAPGQTRSIEIGVKASATPLQNEAINEMTLVAAEMELPERPQVRIPIRTPRLNDNRRGIRVHRAGLQTREPGLKTAQTNPHSLQAMIETVPAVVEAGEPFEFVVTLANQNRQGFRDVSLTLNLGKDIKIVDYKGPPMTRSRMSKDGRHLRFGIVREILPAERLVYRAKAIAQSAGQGTTVARIEAIGLVRPVVVGTDYTAR